MSEQATGEPEPKPPPLSSAASEAPKKKKRRLSFEISEEEYKDLEEFVKHHPKYASNPGEALKHMAGLKTYRMMKENTDPERKKPSMREDDPVLYQDLGIPTAYPCALGEMLKERGLEYKDMIKSVLEGIVKAADTLVKERKPE